MIQNIICLIISTLLIAGCVVPSIHTIFEPVNAFGELHDSDPCGNLFNNKDLLVATFGSTVLKIRINPYAYDGKEVRIEFEPRKDLLLNLPDMVQLIDMDSGQKYNTVTINTQKYAWYGASRGMDPNGITIKAEVEMTADPHNYAYFNFVYPIETKNLRNISIEFSEGSVKEKNGDIINIPKINFQKTENWDLLFITPNC